MSILTIGSINVDYVYHVPHFVREGETLACSRLEKGLGGKGMNQTIALAKAGAQVHHLGAIGKGDDWTLEAIQAQGISTAHILQRDQATGHAIIQLTDNGDNSILLFPGANHSLSVQDAQEALAAHPECDWVLLQNETSAQAAILERALSLGRQVALNPAPCDASQALLPLDKLAVLIVNEVEVCQLSQETTPAAGFEKLRQRCPQTLVVMTLGAEGMRAAQGKNVWQQSAIPAQVVDTTAAGDTVTGYLLAALLEGSSPPEALRLAAHAAALTVSRAGAAASIPLRVEVGF